VLRKAKGVRIGHIISTLFPMGLSFMTLHSFLIIKDHIAVLALPYLLLAAASYFAKEIHQLPSSADRLIKVTILQCLKIIVS
jgi:hypothetical protein